jgi:hypothetical protein
MKGFYNMSEAERTELNRLLDKHIDTFTEKDKRRYEALTEKWFKIEERIPVSIYPQFT